MKTILVVVALAIAAPGWAQAPLKMAEVAKAAPKRAKAAKKSTWKRQEDARHCLQRSDNDAIIRCAEEYL